MFFFLCLLVLLFLQHSSVYGQTIQVCNDYALLPGKPCTGVGDCPDFDPNDGGTSACSTVLGVERDICNNYSLNPGVICFSNDANCPDLTSGDAGQGACGVLVAQIPGLGLDLPYRFHPNTGQYGFSVLQRQALEAVTQRLPLYEEEDCRAAFTTALAGQHCSQSDGSLFICTDPAFGGSSTLYCDVAGDWTASGGTSGLQANYDFGNDVAVGVGGTSWSALDSEARAFVKCNAGCTAGKREWYDATNGWTEKVFPDAHQIVNIASTFALITQGNGTELERLTAAGVHTYSNAGKPTKSVYWPAGALSTDGTNCAAPADATLNSGPVVATFSCADSTSSVFYGQAVMPDSWDAGTVTFELTVWHGTTETITFAGDFSAQCRGDGEVPSSTWGTVQAADVAITTTNRIEQQTTAALTAAGTCAAGDALFWRYVVDATNFSANAANAKVIGVKMEYATGSRDDE